MPAPGIVEAFDVVEHVSLGLVSRAADLASHPLDLERGEEALYRRARHRARTSGAFNGSPQQLPDRLIEQATP